MIRCHVIKDSIASIDVIILDNGSCMNAGNYILCRVCLHDTLSYPGIYYLLLNVQLCHERQIYMGWNPYESPFSFTSLSSGRTFRLPDPRLNVEFHNAQLSIEDIHPRKEVSMRIVYLWAIYCALHRLYQTGHDISWLKCISLRESRIISYGYVIVMIIQSVFMQRPVVLTCCIVLYQEARFYDKEVAMYSISHILPDPTVDEHPPIPTKIHIQYAYEVQTTDTLTTSVL